MQKQSVTINALKFALFAVTFSLTFAAYKFTVAPSLGPAGAAGWAAGAAGAGFGLSALYSPFFKLLLLIFGKIAVAETLAGSLNQMTIIFASLFAGMMSLLYFHLFTRLQTWGPFLLAVVAACMTGISRLVWANGLLVNPVPTALFLTASALVLVLPRDEKTGVTPVHYLAGSSFLFGLAAATHIAVLFFLPAFMSFTCTLNNRKTKWFPAIFALLIPLFMFLLPQGDAVHPVKGLFSAAPGIFEGSILLLNGWSALWSLTPAATVLAIAGIGLLVIRHNNFLISFGLLLAGLIAQIILGGEFGQFSAILIAVLIVLLSMLAIVHFLSRIPGVLSLLLIFLLPMSWALLGPKLSRSTETIWEAHAKNTIRTSRYESIILSTDELLVNTPFAYLQKAQLIRPDVLLVNPSRLSNHRYVSWVSNHIPERYPELKPVTDSLAVFLSASPDKAAMKNHLTGYIRKTISIGWNDKGVLVSPGYSPPLDSVYLVPEGLLVRVRKEEESTPFHFTGLELKKVKIDPTAPFLYQRAIATYPAMFTARGSWMLKKQFTAEGMEYIRWALKIDPDYVPAQILAKEYGISGPPHYYSGKD